MTQQVQFPTPLEIVAGLDSILAGPGGETSGSEVSIVGADPIGPSPHRLADVSAAAIAVFGRQLAAIDEDRESPAQKIAVRAADAYDQLRAPLLATVNGVSPDLLSDDPSLLGLNGFYPTNDGWVFLVSTYPHLRAAVCSVLDCPPTAEAIASASRSWTAIALEEAVVAAGGVAAAARTAVEWNTHPVGKHLADRPVIELERIGDAAPRPLPDRSAGEHEGSLWAPLKGVRMVDNTHVIAGPVAARLFATFGADVVHTSRPDRPDPVGMLAITGGGKRNTYADLRTDSGSAAFGRIASESDVVLNSYRNLEQFGFAPEQLAERYPGIIAAELHCWGSDGPWADRGGFDQLASAATGFALEEGTARGLADGRPALPPTYLLNDYLAAYLTAAGIAAALRRRATEGGSWRVRVNLAKVCMWVRDQGILNAADITQIPIPTPVIARYTVSGPIGTITEPVIPITFSNRATPTPQAPSLLGATPPDFGW